MTNDVYDVLGEEEEMYDLFREKTPSLPERLPGRSPGRPCESRAELDVEKEDEINPETGMPEGIEVSLKRREEVLAKLDRRSRARERGQQGQQHVIFPDGTVRRYDFGTMAAMEEQCADLARSCQDATQGD